MNQAQILSLVRQVLLFAGGFAIAKGWVPDMATLTANVDLLMGALGAVATAGASVWALYERRHKSIVKTAATIVPVPVASQQEVGIQHPVAPK